MMAAARRSMEDLLREQRAAEDDTKHETSTLNQPPPPAAPALPDTDIPAPYQTDAEGELDERGRRDLATCEAALEVLRVAFAQAGKALQVIRDARLYRETHGTFEEYCQDRWDMTRQQASRLIQAWPLAQRLSPIGDKIINEAQIRELLPVAEQYGEDAAASVYETIATTEGTRVTAAVIKGAVATLPKDQFDPAVAAEQIRQYLGGALDTPDQAPNPAQVFVTEVGKLRRILHRVVRQDTLKAAAAEHPDEVKQVLTEMRSLLDQIEQQTL